MKKILCIALFTLFAAFVFSGCNTLSKLGFRESINDEICPVSSIVMNEDEAKKLSDKIPIHLYFADESKNKLKLEIRYIPISEAKKSTANLASVIVQELIKGPEENSALKPTVPKEAKLCAPVKLSDGVATVDLSKELIEKHQGGKALEQLTIYSIVNSLTELKDIQKVKFLIEGKSQKEFKGNFKFDNLFPRSTSLIEKGPVSSTQKTVSGKIF